MAAVIDKLFKGYTIKEIEEILLRAGINADKSTKKPFSAIPESTSRDEKRMLTA